MRWTSQVTQFKTFTVLPDGCRDILIHTRRNQPSRISLTDWDLQPRQIALNPNDRISGYRLRPGLCITADVLSEAQTEQDVVALIDNLQSQDIEISTAIETLSAENATPLHTARQCGVSLRSLQRQFRKHALLPPEFWRLLGRARRAAIALPSNQPLTDIAGIYGYSDQAHMTRAFQRWFGHTPGQIKASPGLLEQISQPALGTWTGEQSSIR